MRREFADGFGADPNSVLIGETVDQRATLIRDLHSDLKRLDDDHLLAVSRLVDAIVNEAPHG